MARCDPLADPRSYQPNGLSSSRPYTGGLADDLTAVSAALPSHVQRHAEREDNEQRHERCGLMDRRREDERDEDVSVVTTAIHSRNASAPPSPTSAAADDRTPRRMP